MNVHLNLNHPDANPIPPEVRDIVQHLLDGTIRSLVIVAEMPDGILDGIFLDIDGSTSNPYALLGAMEVTKRDLMHMFVDSRAPRVESNEGDGE